MYLDEQKADGLHQAAVLADDYSLTHKNSFLRPGQQVSSLVSEEINRRSRAVRGRNNGQGRGRPDTLLGGPVCYYCKRRGHVMAECQVLEKKNGRTSNVTVSAKTGLVRTW